MATDTGETHVHQAGFVESWLRRCGERPLRSFIYLWMGFWLGWLLLGFLGFKYVSHPDVPIPLEAVPYADYSPGGQYSFNRTIDFDPATLPQHDPTLLDRDRYLFQVWPLSTGELRLAVDVSLSRFSFGFPEPWVGGATGTSWDVTDPTKPFPRFLRENDNGTYFDAEAMRVTWFFNGHHRVRQWQVGLDLHQIQYVLPGLQAGATSVVVILWCCFTWRQRRRKRLGCCLSCGHNLGPSPSSAICPECGNPSDENGSNANQAQRLRCRAPQVTAARVLWMWFALALVYGSLCVLTARRQAIPATQERLNELAEESVRIAMDLQGSPNRAGWMLSDNECGWPLPLIEQWDSQVYECYPGQQPSAVPRRYPPSLNVAWAPMWQLQFAMDDPSKMRVINIYWARILASIMFLQTAALCVMASFLMIRRLWRRKHVT